MADKNKKRTTSFRKLFPSIFFHQKSKVKNNEKNLQIQTNNTSVSSSATNQYQNQKSVIKSDKIRKRQVENIDCIYENIRSPVHQREIETLGNDALSNHSSSSTLVSDSVKKSSYIDKSPGIHNHDKDYANYMARPQVPRKPHEGHEVYGHYMQKDTSCFTTSEHPDVYYHSLEKLNEQITPFDELQIHTTSQAQANPASVGAEIKKVSTKFLISPKKEADVRTLQPTRARSLSFTKTKEILTVMLPEHVNNNAIAVSKPYNYPAPTSLMPLNHKIPSMPKTVSPYDHVRKTIIEAEAKRNSLHRINYQGKYAQSPKLSEIKTVSRVSSPNSTDSEKERTRQKVEAFYWQKLKELKDKEDEYIMRQSLNKTNRIIYSSCSTPTSHNIYESRSFTLPRGQNQMVTDITKNNTSQPFSRGAPERRTDSFVTNRSSFGDADVIYRHPEKLNSQKQTPIFQGGSLSRDYRSMPINQLPAKRVSFEENELKVLSCKDGNLSRPVFAESFGQARVINTTKGLSRIPPQPPVRTTSVNNHLIDANIANSFQSKGHLAYSESESGSEPGEIQRILQNTPRNQSLSAKLAPAVCIKMCGFAGWK